MKYFTLLIISVLISFNLIAGSGNLTDAIAETKDSLKEFTITYTHGDNAVMTDYISVYKDNNSWYASALKLGHPFVDEQNYYKVVKMGPNPVNCCEEFVGTTEKLPGYCENNSSVMYELSLTIGEKSFTVNGPCDWGKMDFWALFDTLFGKDEYWWKKPSELKTIKKYNAAITGDWYLQHNADSLHVGDSLFFSKTPMPGDSTLFWKFNGEKGFYGKATHGNRALIYNTYELGIYPGKQRFALTAYQFNNRNYGRDPCINFEVVKYDTSHLILRVVQIWK